MQEFLELLAFATMLSGQFLAVIAGRTWHTIVPPDASPAETPRVPAERMSEA